MISQHNERQRLLLEGVTDGTQVRRAAFQADEAHDLAGLADRRRGDGRGTAGSEAQHPPWRKSRPGSGDRAGRRRRADYTAIAAAAADSSCCRDVADRVPVRRFPRRDPSEEADNTSQDPYAAYRAADLARLAGRNGRDPLRSVRAFSASARAPRSISRRSPTACFPLKEVLGTPSSVRGWPDLGAARYRRRSAEGRYSHGLTNEQGPG